MVFSGYEQEPPAALVRYDALRESSEGAAILCAEEEELTTEGTEAHGVGQLFVESFEIEIFPDRTSFYQTFQVVLGWS
jgi:hypothetical protein